jgi:hypothetical protein
MERLQTLVHNVQAVQAKMQDESTNLGGLKELSRAADERKDTAQRSLDQLRTVMTKANRAELELAIAEDFSDVITGALELLETEYVKEVGKKTSEMFLRIVGNDPEFEGAVFTGVEIAENFDIKVVAGASSLDPSFELNGASQRALTLAFIWSLMDVAGVQAPRIIDTPLGMVAGGVRTRMVNEITAPGDQYASQTILLLTRAEIRDIEDLLDDRAGAYATLTLSSVSLEDLAYPWGDGQPEIKQCACSHRYSCRICARKYDAQHNVMFQEGGGS